MYMLRKNTIMDGSDCVITPAIFTVFGTSTSTVIVTE